MERFRDFWGINSGWANLFSIPVNSVTIQAILSLSPLSGLGLDTAQGDVVVAAHLVLVDTEGCHVYCVVVFLQSKF